MEAPGASQQAYINSLTLVLVKKAEGRLLTVAFLMRILCDLPRASVCRPTPQRACVFIEVVLKQAYF